MIIMRSESRRQCTTIQVYRSYTLLKRAAVRILSHLSRLTLRPDYNPLARSQELNCVPEIPSTAYLAKQTTICIY
jgi:hypothetical protein